MVSMRRLPGPKNPAEMTYYVQQNGAPMSGTNAAKTLSSLDSQTMALTLGYFVQVQAERKLVSLCGVIERSCVTDQHTHHKTNNQSGDIQQNAGLTDSPVDYHIRGEMHIGFILIIHLLQRQTMYDDVTLKNKHEAEKRQGINI